MQPFERIIFVCTQGNSCPQQGAVALHTLLKEAVAKAGLKDKIRVNHAGCLDQCGHGPLVVVYPENVWYAHVTRAEAEIIFREHILAGRPVERLVFAPRQPGANKLPRNPAGLPIEGCTSCRDGRAVTLGLASDPPPA
jgi:(2Fe-2S) ferredoxin